MLGRSIGRWTLAVVFLAASNAAAIHPGRDLAQAWTRPSLRRRPDRAPAADDMLPEPLGLSGIGLSEKSGRVFYPALAIPPGMPGMVKDILNQSRRPLVRMFSDILTNAGEPKATLYFLFRGDQPLELRLNESRAETFVTVPAVDPMGIQRQLLAWWHAYTAQPGLLQRSRLSAGRGKLSCNRCSPAGWACRAVAAPGRGWEEMFDTNRTDVRHRGGRVAIEQQRMLGAAASNEPANLPLPPPIVPPDLSIPTRCPACRSSRSPCGCRVECLYVRFGNFTNFLWFQDTMARWNGDVEPRRGAGWTRY